MDAAKDLRHALVEILRQLNRDEMQEPEVPGLELEEVRELLARGPFPMISKAETHQAIEVLLRNGLARELTDARYAWTRGRMVSHRFTITTPGKGFLLRSIQRVGRV